MYISSLRRRRGVKILVSQAQHPWFCCLLLASEPLTSVSAFCKSLIYNGTKLNLVPFGSDTISPLLERSYAKRLLCGFFVPVTAFNAARKAR